MRRALAALLLVACGDDPAPPPEAGEELAFEIVHLGISGPYTFADVRLSLTGAALARSPADVICVQGLWRAEDRSALIAAVDAEYPYSLDLATGDASEVDDPTGEDGTVPEPTSEPACAGESEVRLEIAVDCLSKTCSIIQNDPAGELGGEYCLELGPCLDEVEALRDDADPQQRCRACFLTHVRGASPFDQVLDRCTELPGNPLAHEGQHGMVLLSRWPLSNPDIRVLPAEGLRRAVIAATIDTPETTIDVYCASLGPGDLGLPGDPSVSEPYPGPYGNPLSGWAAEHSLQIDKLIGHVDSRSAGRPAVLLGNLGASAGVSQDGEVVIRESAPAAFARLQAAYDEAVTPDTLPACTLCPLNRMLEPGTEPTWLNRIFLSGLPDAEVRESTRLYLGDVVEVPGGPLDRVPLVLQYGFRSTVLVKRH